MPETASSDLAAARLREKLRAAIRERGFPLHPELVVALEPGGVDPTARSSTNRHGETITAELRTVEGAYTYYALEGLFVGLTPLAALCAVYALLQTLAGDWPEGVDVGAYTLLDVWKELAPFRELAIAGGGDVDASTAGEEAGRALWHAGRILDEILNGREVNRDT